MYIKILYLDIGVNMCRVLEVITIIIKYREREREREREHTIRLNIKHASP